MSDLVAGILVFLILLAIFCFYILFLITQQNTLKAIQPRNRLMRPGQVWLQLIPFFNIVWQFIVVARISNSIRLEFGTRQNDSILGYTDFQSVEFSTSRPTYDIGIAMCVLNCCVVIPVLGNLAALASLICLIVYWKKLSEYKRMIEVRTI